MHHSDSTFHAVCEHELKYCVLAKKCVHQHYITLTHRHVFCMLCIRSSLNKYDTFPFGFTFVKSPVQCVIVFIISGHIRWSHMCAHVGWYVCAVASSNHHSTNIITPNDQTNERTNEWSYDVDCVWLKQRWKGKKRFLWSVLIIYT